MELQRRGLILTASAFGAGLLTPATLRAQAGGGAPDPSQALTQTDHALFPASLGHAINAVLGGFVLFLVRHNPIALLRDSEGGTVADGAPRAAGQYVQHRVAEVGNVVAGLQNATLGDYRADTAHIGPYVDLIDQRHAEVAEPTDRILDTLNRFAANKPDGPLPGEAQKALVELSQQIDAHQNDTGYLAGCVAKHRDVGTVYAVIAPQVQLIQDPQYQRYAEVSQARAERQKATVLATYQKLADAQRITTSLLPPDAGPKPPSA